MRIRAGCPKLCDCQYSTCSVNCLCFQTTIAPINVDAVEGFFSRLKVGCHMICLKSLLIFLEIEPLRRTAPSQLYSESHQTCRNMLNRQILSLFQPWLAFLFLMLNLFTNLYDFDVWWFSLVCLHQFFDLTSYWLLCIFIIMCSEQLSSFRWIPVWHGWYCSGGREMMDRWWGSFSAARRRIFKRLLLLWCPEPNWWWQLSFFTRRTRSISF